MKNKLTQAAGIGMGLVISILVIAAVQYLNQVFYPMPSDIDPTDMDSIATYMEHMPVGAFWIVILSYALGSFTGGFIARKMDSNVTPKLAMIVGVILLILGLINLILIPHPVWFWIVSLSVYLPAAWAGALLAGENSIL